MLKSLLKISFLIFLPLTLLVAQTLPPQEKNATVVPTAKNAVVIEAAASQTSLIPSPPTVTAQSYILMDASSGNVLAQHGSEQRVEPASLTKIMTLYIISKALQDGTIKMDDLVMISQKAWRTGGSKMFVRVGTQVSVHDLILGIVVDSGNDACVALAEYIGGSEETFVNMMNTQAKILGLKNTHFMNCTGVPQEDHYTAAADLASLSRHLILNFAQNYEAWYGQKWFTYNKIRQPNRNRLLWRYEHADGLKTGHTDTAGYCLVGSAQKEDMRLITVIMGASSDEQRFTDAIKLLNYGFRFFKTYLVHSAQTPVASHRVWSGRSKMLVIGLEKDFSVSIPPHQYQSLKTILDIQPQLKAPITKGQVVGQMNVTIKNKIIASRPIIALEDNPRGNIWRRLVDWLISWFQSFMGTK